MPDCPDTPTHACLRPDTHTAASHALPPASTPICTQASYALGYNLAIEYLADYEKTWMLDSFRDLNARVLHKDIDWIFLEVRCAAARGGGGGCVGQGVERCRCACVGCGLVVHGRVQGCGHQQLALFVIHHPRVCASPCCRLPLHHTHTHQQVHAEGEAEHAAIGHNAVLNLVPREHIPIMQQAMADHDRDFAVFYNRMAELLESASSQ